VAEINAAGQPTYFTVNAAGNYTVLPSSPVTLTGGSGTGTVTVTPGWAILSVTAGTAGSGYTVYPPPLVTSSTGTAYHSRMEIVPQMTPASATLTLNLAGGAIQAGSGAFSASGSVATVLGSIGPAGSHTTVQEWLTITNGSGTIRYIPCF
jgi:hypothetical protein